MGDNTLGKVRFGIVGVGNMGTSHSKSILENKIENAELVAICDIDPERLERPIFADSKVKTYSSAEEMYKSGEIDAVIIATPHYDHPSLAISAFKAGLHVLIEKPAGVYTKQVREMNEEATKTDRIFGIMYNQRTNPVYQKVRDLINKGELGAIKRIVWIITNWYRPQSYHDSGSWRSMWATEGGGVLINQCPHQLDLWWWLFGMPESIRSFCKFGRHYNIEVEDDVTAYMEYDNGTTGLFVTTTGESPGTNRLEIACDRGNLIVENNKITFHRNVVSERQFNEEFKGVFGNPEVWKCEIPVAGDGGKQHVGILNDFTKAILEDGQLLAPGNEGMFGLSISNAIHLSTWTDSTIDPSNIDEDLFYNILQEKIKNSTFKKTVKKQIHEV